MDFQIPSLVIDGGSHSIKAGLSTDDAPILVMPSQYSKGDEIYVNDEIDLHPENEVLTTYSDGLAYNWDAIQKQYEHIYRRMDVASDELPLVMTENMGNSTKNRGLACQMAFEGLEVPVFSLLKSQLCTSYGIGRATSFIIDLGADITSVTPIHNGLILNKGALRSKYAGGFLNVHLQKYLERKTGHSIDWLMPKRFQNVACSESFKMFQMEKTMTDIKSYLAALSPYPLHPKDVVLPHQQQQQAYSQLEQPPAKAYKFPNGQVIKDISVVEQYQLAEPIFQPQFYSQAFAPEITLPVDSLGLNDLILNSLKKLEATGNVYQELLQNIVIVGGSSFIPGLEQRIINDLIRVIPNFAIQAFANPVVDERNFSTWNGAVILSSNNHGSGSTGFENGFISKAEYQEFGEDAIAEKFK